MADYIIQKVVAPDKVVKKRRLTLVEYGERYIGQRKYDGCCAILRGGKTYSRTGEQYQCLDEVAELPEFEGLVPIGEAWWRGEGNFPEISGEFRRHVRSAKMQFMLNDVLTEAEFEQGYSLVPYTERMNRLPFAEGHRWQKVSGWLPGTYGDPQDKCNALVDLGGYDGLIMRDPVGTWQRGSGTTGEIIKIKRVLSFDLLVLGMEFGEGKHKGRMGALVVDFRGKRLRVGTGFTDEQRDTYHQFLGGKIVEVEAMDLSSDGLLREPRFKGIRHDKLEPDA